MNTLADIVEQNPALAADTFSNVEAALNQVLPGSDFHDRYLDATEVGLALVVGRTAQVSYNPIEHPELEPLFSASNQDSRPDAWGEIAPEFLGDATTNIGRFTFFALAKTENMRMTGKITSYNPDELAIVPGQVGFAGGRKLFRTFVTPSGLWEVHDHLVAGTYAEDIVGVANGTKEPRFVDELAEHFKREFAKIAALHEGVPAAVLSHKNIGKLLPLIDSLPYQG